MIASEFDDVTFCCAPLTNIVVEVKGPDDENFTKIDPGDTRLLNDTDLDNYTMLTYFNVTRDDNGTQFFCNLVGVEQTRVLTLIVHCKP